MLKIRRLPHTKCNGNIDLGNKKSCLQDFGLSRGRNYGCIINLK